MAVRGSNLVAFGVGLAAGAVAYATYPRWKHKVEPLIAALAAGAAAAFHDAQAASESQPQTPSDPVSHPGHEAPPGPWGAPVRSGSSTTAPASAG